MRGRTRVCVRARTGGAGGLTCLPESRRGGGDSSPRNAHNITRPGAPGPVPPLRGARGVREKTEKCFSTMRGNQIVPPIKRQHPLRTVIPILLDPGHLI